VGGDGGKNKDEYEDEASDRRQEDGGVDVGKCLS